MCLSSLQGQYYGELKHDWSRDGLGLYEIAYAPGLKMAKHSHAGGRCVLILAGAVRHRSRHEVECGPRSVVFVAPDEVHEDTVTGSVTKCFIAEFGHAWLQRSGRDAKDLDRLSLAGRYGLLCGVLGRIRQECRYSDGASPLIVDGLLLEALGYAQRAGRSGSTAPPWIRSICDLLRDRFRERLTIAELAAEAGVHPVHLCREFRRYTGSTIGTFLRRSRVEYACRELAGTRRSIAEIALDAGFSSQAHLSATFRRLTNLSPRAYQQYLAHANSEDLR